MSNHDDLQPDLQPVIDQLRANRPEATALELDAVKQRVRARVSAPARRRTRRSELMKSRLVVLTMLVLGMLLSTTGAGLAVSGCQAATPSIAQYAHPVAQRWRRRPRRPGLGRRRAAEHRQRQRPPPPAVSEGADVQPSRQVEAGANDNKLPFTGFAAIPILLGGIALLSAGLVLRRRTGDER